MGELEPEHTIAAQANRHTGGTMRRRTTKERGRRTAGQMEDKTRQTGARAEDRLVTMETLMLQSCSYKQAR